MRLGAKFPPKGMCPKSFRTSDPVRFHQQSFARGAPTHMRYRPASVLLGHVGPAQAACGTPPSTAQLSTGSLRARDTRCSGAQPSGAAPPSADFLLTACLPSLAQNTPLLFQPWLRRMSRLR
eukprot:scaffold108179_cov66-Phaeocystis_antarctica.AAC.3